MFRLTTRAIVLAAFIQTAATTHNPSVPIAKTKNGTIQGLHLPSFNQDTFLGIPFAQAPRVSNPLPINQTWSETEPFNATAYGITCYGFGSNIDLNLTQGEDCLNLNIVRPAQKHKYELLPVLVWIYGGGWTQGSNADPMWNLSYVVQTSVQNNQPILAVSINYRLSFLGFPVGNTSLEAGISNLGLKDQRIALQWIQENIASFGGDPAKVTVWGESAGGISVGTHLISYGGNGSRGLFRGAIMSSGTVVGTANPKFPYMLNDAYDSVVEHAGCGNETDTLGCLREAPIENIYPFENEGALGAAFTPVIDGEFIRREPLLELEDGDVHRVPIMVGNNEDEGLFVVNLIGAPGNESALRSLLETFLPGLSNETIDSLLEAYPGDGPAPPYYLPPSFPWCQAMAVANLTCTPLYRRTAAILGDYFADTGRRIVASTWPEAVYSYRFSATSSSLPIENWKGLGPGFANHGTDLAYDFRLPPGYTTLIHYYPPVKKTAAHADLSRGMVSRFISFVHDLDPNKVDLADTPFWPRYTNGRSNYVFNVSESDQLDVHIEPDTYRKEGIDLWRENALEAFYGESEPHVGSFG